MATRGDELNLVGEFDGSLVLNTGQRDSFYDRMKRVVVVVEASWDKPGCKTNRGVQRCTEYGGGVIISDTPHILSSAHRIPTHPKSLLLRARLFNDTDFRTCKQISLNRKKDLLLLAIEKPRPNDKWDYAGFAGPRRLTVGMELFSIFHPTRDLCYSLVVGQLGFGCDIQGSTTPKEPVNETPACRVFNHVNRLGGLDKGLSDIDGCLPLLQINNFHGMYGSAGAPVFDSTGRIVGLHSFCWANFDFAIHVDVLKEFYAETLAHPPSDGKK